MGDKLALSKDESNGAGISENFRRHLPPPEIVKAEPGEFYTAHNSFSPLALKFRKLHPDAEIPERKTRGSVGYDLKAVTFGPTSSPGLSRAGTGIAVCPPEGYYFELHARSSLPSLGWTIANSVGIIDPDYRGEVMVLVSPISDNPVSLEGARIAQLILKKDYSGSAVFVEVPHLDDTGRGTGGFGSTGQ